MRITIDDYGFVFIKLASLKSIIMEEADRKKIPSFSDLDTLSSYIGRFFPGFHPQSTNVLDIERELWRVYFLVIEKILIASPEVIQVFLKSLMVKFEILNIKTTILDVIAHVPEEVRRTQVYVEPAKILERGDFLHKLLRAKTLEEIIKAVIHTPYHHIVKKGLDKFKEMGEIFFLEHSLDKYYYDNLIQTSHLYSGREKKLIEHYISLKLDYYNLNLIFRAIFNKIPKEIIKIYLIPNGFLFREKENRLLLSSETKEDFLKNMGKILVPHKDYKDILLFLEDFSPEGWDDLSHYFIQKIADQYQREIMADIPLTTLFRIFQILIHKEIEIGDFIARSVQISLASQQA